MIDGGWVVPDKYGESRDAGFAFEIAAVVVPHAMHVSWMELADSVDGALVFPSVRLPRSEDIIGEAYRAVKKRR